MKQYITSIVEMNATSVRVHIDGKAGYFSRFILQGEFREGDSVRLTISEDEFVTSVVKVEQTPQQQSLFS